MKSRAVKWAGTIALLLLLSFYFWNPFGSPTWNPIGRFTGRQYFKTPGEGMQPTYKPGSKVLVCFSALRIVSRGRVTSLCSESRATRACCISSVLPLLRALQLRSAILCSASTVASFHPRSGGLETTRRPTQIRLRPDNFLRRLFLPWATISRTASTAGDSVQYRLKTSSVARAPNKPLQPIARRRAPAERQR